MNMMRIRNIGKTYRYFLDILPIPYPGSRNQKGTWSRIRIATLLVSYPMKDVSNPQTAIIVLPFSEVPYFLQWANSTTKSVAFCKYFLLFTFFKHQKLWYLARLFWIAMKTRILPDLKLSFRTASSVWNILGWIMWGNAQDKKELPVLQVYFITQLIVSIGKKGTLVGSGSASL